MEQFPVQCVRERGPVRVNFQEWELAIKQRPRQSFEDNVLSAPLIRKERE